MKKNLLSALLLLAMAFAMLAGCAPSGGQPSNSPADKTDAPAQSAVPGGAAEELEFYHGYYHDESEWPAAKVMRDIYDEFAAAHAGGPVTFKPIAVENRDDIVSAQVAGGSYPDVVDLGSTIPQAAISQGLILDLKPFIDENGLKDAVGLNYTQNNVDGHIYTVHDQVETRGLWYNAALLEQAGASVEELSTWTGYASAMEKVRALNNGSYGYVAGQGSVRMMFALLASTAEGRAVLDADFGSDVINSQAFADAFKQIAALDQANGSAYTTADLGNLMADFNQNGIVAVLANGVWNASGISAELAGDIQPTIFPEGVAMATAGTGLTVSSGMSEAKTELALEFVKYMTSAEVQAKIFTGVQANPCNTTLDLNAMAKESGDEILMKLADACDQANHADIIVSDLWYKWGGDVSNSIINALMECAVSGADIDGRFEQLQKELLALIG